MKERALQLLRQTLNNPVADFRDGQWESISALVQNKSRLLVIQRTGWGKSIVYFLATKLLREQGAGVSLLISPLLSLMRNQISAAAKMGVTAETINSSNKDNWKLVKSKILADQIDILLVSPERLANQDFTETILIPIAQKIGLFVVDEAHCISDWGHDFRPDYRRIVRILQALPATIPVLATTATANNRVVADIKHQLGENLQVVRGALIRDSLQLQNIAISRPAERIAWIAAHLPKLPGSGIIYALTINDAKLLTEWLRCQNIDVESYYGALDTKIKIELEDRLLNNDIKALVATTALGMGFDKPDLGFVIHYQRPGSVVHYYQQVGRAGRAVQQAYGILLSGAEDDTITDHFIQTAFPLQSNVLEVIATLQAAEGLSIGELESKTNLARNRLDKVLKYLSLESPSPIIQNNGKWYATAVRYELDSAKIQKLTAIRHQEQQQMRDYMTSSQCLMVFLATALDDIDPQPCGKCAVCLGQDLLSTATSSLLQTQALEHLMRSDCPIEPRKQWKANALKNMVLRAISGKNYGQN
jgi:ATP-dependent DNA helicase RecQ